MEEREARERAARVEGLLGELEELPDPAARDRAIEAVQALVELYGEGLARVVERAGPELAGELAGDELVGHLLILHDLHPVALEERVRGALEQVRPYLSSHGGDVELAGLDGGTVRLRLRGSCDGCPSSATTLKLAVEDAIRKAAPDVEEIEAEGASPGPGSGSGLLQLEVADGVAAGAPSRGRPSSPPPGDVDWTELGSLPELSDGGTLVMEVAGERLLLLRVERDLYAYRDGCPRCGASLERAVLRGAELGCPGCGSSYDARRAGRCLDLPELHLEPVPLLAADGGAVQVAAGAANGAAA